jgi:hypothetical protein
MILWSGNHELSKNSSKFKNDGSEKYVPKPGESIGPNAPTTAAESPTMRRMASFFQMDHYQWLILEIYDTFWEKYGHSTGRLVSLKVAVPESRGTVVQCHASTALSELPHIRVEHRIDHSCKLQVLSVTLLVPFRGLLPVPGTSSILWSSSIPNAMLSTTVCM